MSLRFSDITVNDHFIDFNGITYQKIANSGDGCCSVGLNAIPINTGVGATAQFFPERLIIAHAAFSDTYSDSDTGVQFFGEPFNAGDGLLSVSGNLYIGALDCDAPIEDFACVRIASDIVDFVNDKGIVRSVLSVGATGLDVVNSADKTGDYITTAMFNFPAVALTSGDLHSVRFGGNADLDVNWSYFGFRINGSGGLGVEYGTDTGVIELSEDYLANYSGQSVYLSCNYNYDTKIANISVKSPNAGLTTVMSPTDNDVNSTQIGVVGFVPEDNNVGITYWQTMITLTG